MNEDTIYAYPSDLTRPYCYCCGSIVPQDTDTPEIPWKGTCIDGHTATYQLDLEDEADF